MLFLLRTTLKLSTRVQQTSVILFYCKPQPPGETVLSCIAALLQVEGEGELVQAQNQKLHRELWQRQREALLRSQPEAAEAAAAAKEAAMTHMPSMTDHPAWIQQGQLYPHQLQV